MNTNTCENCSYMSMETESRYVGRCHANPPTVVIYKQHRKDEDNGVTRENTKGFRPQVNVSDISCRYFQEKNP